MGDACRKRSKHPTPRALFVAFGVAMLSCAKASAPSALTAPPVQAQAADLASAPTTDEKQAVGMEKRPRLGDAAAYIDGKSVGVLRRLELPPSLSPHAVQLVGGPIVPRYAMGDYVHALGVDLQRVRAVHIYGGKRIAALDGDEFRRIAGRLMFSFTGGERGKPRLHWPVEPIKVSTTIDMISALTIYVGKAPPAFDAKGRVLTDDQGMPIEGVPYAPAEQGKGTRIYVDGALVATLKRKTLTNDVVVDDGAAQAHFSFASYLAKVVDTKHARAIDFVSGDDMFLRLGPKDMLQGGAGPKLAFTLPARSQGQAVVDLEAQRAKVSAVELYVKTAPPERSVTHADDFLSPAEPGGGGGDGSDEAP